MTLVPSSIVVITGPSEHETSAHQATFWSTAWIDMVVVRYDHSRFIETDFSHCCVIRFQIVCARDEEFMVRPSVSHKIPIRRQSPLHQTSSSSFSLPSFAVHQLLRVHGNSACLLLLHYADLTRSDLAVSS